MRRRRNWPSICVKWDIEASEKIHNFVTVMELHSYIRELCGKGENTEVEFKSALGGFSNSFWETYSASEILHWPEPGIEERFQPDMVELALFLGSTTQKTTPETTLETTPEKQDTPERIISLIRRNPSITVVEMTAALNLSRDGIMYHLRKMNNTQIKHIGPNKGGHWEIIKFFQ